MINILNKNYISSDKTTLKEEIRKIFKYLRDSGEFPYDAPKMVFRKGNSQNPQANAQNVNLSTAHYDIDSDTIVILMYDGRFLRDYCISFLHELRHCQQNREGRLKNIQTDNVTEDDNLDKLEREAYEYSGIWFRKYKDSQKKEKYIKEYKQYAENNLFDQPLSYINDSEEGIVKDENGIEVKYIFIPQGNNSYTFKWFPTSNNTNNSTEAQIKIIATSFKWLKDFIYNEYPNSISIEFNVEENIYSLEKYEKVISAMINNQYVVKKSNNGFILSKIEKALEGPIRKRMSTLNETYSESLDYWQNGDMNSNSVIERYNTIKKHVERNIINEIYDPPFNFDYNPFPVTKDITLRDHLLTTVCEITLNHKNSAKINGTEKDGNFTVGNIIYVYKIYKISNPYNDGKNFYNIYFHPEDDNRDMPIGNTTKENYITILNTMYNIILKFTNKYKPDYIGISSMDEKPDKKSSKHKTGLNYHAVYANLVKDNSITGYRRKDSNVKFNTPKGTGQFVVLQKIIQPSAPKPDIQDTLSEYMQNIANIILEADKQYTIYIDLDDTLIDFDGGFKKLTGKSYSTYKNEYSKIEAWDKIEEVGEKFWEDLEWKKDSRILWEYLKKYNPIILTISPDESFIKEGKRKWVDKHISPSQKIIFAQVNGKGQYANENSILIDNKTKNIYNWIDNNGIGIHFTNVNNALNKIKQLGL